MNPGAYAAGLTGSVVDTYRGLSIERARVHAQLAGRRGRSLLGRRRIGFVTKYEIRVIRSVGEPRAWTGVNPVRLGWQRLLV